MNIDHWWCVVSMTKSLLDIAQEGGMPQNEAEIISKLVLKYAGNVYEETSEDHLLEMVKTIVFAPIP